MKYQVFITKSAKVAALLVQANRDGKNISRVSYGKCENYDTVPKMYYGRHLFACVIEYTVEARVPDYELIIA